MSYEAIPRSILRIGQRWRYYDGSIIEIISFGEREHNCDVVVKHLKSNGIIKYYFTETNFFILKGQDLPKEEKII